MTDKYAHLRPVRDRQCYRADGVPKRKFTVAVGIAGLLMLLVGRI